MDDSVAMADPGPQGLPLEQRIYALSPLGVLPTTLGVFVLLSGSFVLVAEAEHVALFQRLGGGFVLSNAAWPALVLSLLCCTALAMQRYVRLVEAKDAPAYAGILTGGMASAVQITNLSAPDTHLGRATLIGLVAGLALSVVVRMSEYGEGHIIPSLAMIWFGAATTLLTVLFAR